MLTREPPSGDGRRSLTRTIFACASGMRCWLALAYLILALPLALFLAIEGPLGQVPDEPAHAARADSLLHGEMIGRRTLREDEARPQWAAGVVIDPSVVWTQYVLTADPPELGRFDRDILAAVKRYSWRDPIFFEIGTTATYLPVFYLPVAATLAAGQLFGALPYETLMAARLVNLAVFLLLAVASLVIARHGRMLLFCTLAMPMTLYLAASLNQDGLIIATAALATALLGRAWSDAPDPRTLSRETDYRMAALALALVIAVKPPYFPLAALLLLPLPAPVRWRLLLPRGAVALLALLPALLWGWYAARHVAAPVSRLPYHPGPLWPGDPTLWFDGTDPAAQLRVLVADPLLIVTLPLRSLSHLPSLFEGMVGGFGSLKFYLPAYVYLAWSAALAASLLADMSNKNRPPIALPWRNAGCIALALIAATFAVWLSQYLTWTNVGYPAIKGPQGRYLLPLLPPAALGVACLPLHLAAGRESMLRAFPLLAAAVGLVAVPTAIFSVYY